jgi:hypothetical protein
MNQNLHKLIGEKMKSGAKGVRGMSIKNMEKFIKNHGQSLLRIKRDRMSLGQLMSEFKEGRNMLEKGRTSPKKSMSPKKNTNNANFKTMMKSVKVKKNWANMNNNSNLGSLPVSPASSKSSVSGYGSSPNEGKNFFVKPIRYRNTFAFNQAPKKGSMNIFPVKGSRRPLSKASVVPKRTYLQVMIGPGKGTESIKAYDRPIMGKFPKETEYNAPVGKSMGRKSVVPFNTTHFRPLRSPKKQNVAPSIPKKEPFVLKKFLESIKSKK